MKKLVLLAIGLFASLLTAQAQLFYNTNILVLRISGYDTTSSIGDQVYIDQYTTNANVGYTPLNSFTVPTSGASSILLNGEPYEGLMTMTPSATNVVFAGFNIALASSVANLLNSTSSQAPRSIASLDAYGNFSVPIKDSTHYSTYTPIGAASDGTNFWMSANGPPTSFGVGTGGYPQVVYMGTAASAAFIQVATNTFSSTLRAVNVFYNTTSLAYGLFVNGTSTNTPTANIYHGGGFTLSNNISGTLPIAATGASNYFPNATAAGGSTAAYDIAINPAGTIAYEADNDIGITKYTKSGGVWVSNYTTLLTNAQGTLTTAFSQTATSVTADWSQSPPNVFATTGETGTNRLVKFSDTNVAGVDIVTTLGLYATTNVTTNTFRGVRFGIQAYGYVSVPPVAFTGNPGQTATFSATILGVPTPSIQWFSNSVANPTWVPITGATTATLTLPSITTAQNGSLFYVQAANIYGSSTNTPVLLTVNNPAISSQPVGATNLLGGSAVNLSVTAVGTGTLSYQWYANGVSLGSAGGAQTASYTVPSSAIAFSKTYYVVITNTGPGVTSTQSASTVVDYTPYLLYDLFAYGAGNNIFAVAGSPWYDINGTSPEYDIANNSVLISQTNGSDGASPFIQAVSQGSDTIISSSFVLNVSSLPTNAGGVYFANLMGGTSSGFGTNSPDYNFVGCVYILTSNASGVAFPGTYRVGIATTNEDYSAASGLGGPTAVVPLDMALNTSYQIVFTYDTSANYASLAVNPDATAGNAGYVSGNDGDAYNFENFDPTVVSTQAPDNYVFTNIGAYAFNLRQRIGEGIMTIGNLEVSLDNTDINGLASVTSWATPQTPVVGFVSPGVSDYTGGIDTIEVAASAIGSGINNLTYTWYANTPSTPSTYTMVNNTGDITGAGTPTLKFSDLAAGDAGTYYCVVGNTANSSSAQSANMVVNVITTPTPPFFISPPTPTTTTNVSVTIDTGATFTVLAHGSGPINYAWYLTNAANPSGVQVGTSATLNLANLQVSQSGTYAAIATGTASPAATSPEYILTVNPPQVINIGQLRTNVLNTTAAPTVSILASYPGTVFSITGICTVATNFVTGQQFYIQDSTGGIQCYVASGGASQPKLGDTVNAIGTVEVYDNALELDMEAIGASPPYTITSTAGEGLPSSSWPIPLEPIVIPSPNYLSANPALTATAIDGSMVEVTNCYFEAYTGTATFTDNHDYVLTNLTGNTVLDAELYTSEKDLSATDGQLFGKVIPYFAYSIIGPIDQYNTTYELYATTIANITTAAPPAVTVGAAITGGGAHVTLTWTAVPYDYTYSVLSSTTVNGTYTKLASGLLFKTTSGTYTDTAPGSTTKFYQIVSP